MQIGFKECRECGELWNVADMASGLCPECGRVHAAHLSDLQRQYEDHLRSGDAAASDEVRKLIQDYTTAQGVRLKDARRV